ncbi:3-phosphoserine/phosphohydroxythreonine transaminase [Salipiger sp. 1_MG-2023]|uniref:3-phosphoserine/phosphohydroxythreonine transaminase n=1 Tax=Salipiger sp. 1_MG-2023 TaxID=3062665 RepID=UPI0026E3278C|nr:3-phosphoserine/phosphohydroxythreonine transaminase [Salipiger sp. 1_MG-2023]MDO6588158.1 3-phosphoserine/phosphohydroxythreonine transaminase [Salipiger sp. 1_MG-2023]
MSYLNNIDHPALSGSLNPPVPADDITNFSPGPTSLPKAVEEMIAAGFGKPGLTSLALSHRSPEFLEIFNHAVASVRKVMNIPENYEVLFTHGGGHGQFAAVPLNLCHEASDVATYVVNGTWSQRGADEGKRYCRVQTIDARDTKTGAYNSFPELTEETIDPDSKYVYLCSNETVNGIELHRLPKLPEARKHIPLVVDASSDFSTKPIDWIDSGIGVLFACASKNIGHPGVTVTVIRKDLLGKDKASPLCPGVFNYTTNSEAGNLWNTPATFNIEVIGHMMDWIAAEGGIDEIERRSIAKAKAIYDVIDGSEGFYDSPVTDKTFRSRMNVPFRIAGGDEELTNRFLIQSWDNGLIGLRTLTPFGIGEYLRASLYTGVALEGAEKLAAFMRDFARENS